MYEERKPNYFTGLDLGQAHEFTAVAVLEQVRVPDPDRPGRKLRHYSVRHLERLPLGMPYPDINARVRGMFAEPPLERSTLAVDITGVGRPVLNLLCQAPLRARVLGVTLTGGTKAVHAGDGDWNVPKVEAIGVLQVLLQTRRLKVSPSLTESDTLVKELTNFRTKVTVSAQDTLAAWREGQHDDLVLAVGVAAWAAERATRELQVWC